MIQEIQETIKSFQGEGIQNRSEACIYIRKRVREGMNKGNKYWVIL